MLGMFQIIIWIQELFLILSIQTVSVCNITEDLSNDLHEIVRIGYYTRITIFTQELIHTPQIRRGGGLRSQRASWLKPVFTFASCFDPRILYNRCP